MSKGMKQFARWLLNLVGYVLYTVVVIVVLLWLLFPGDTVRSWLQRQLNTTYPSLVWEIKNLETALPFKLRISDIRAHEQKDSENPFFTINEVQLAPNMQELLKFQNRPGFKYQLQTLGGTVTGELSSGNGSGVQCTGELQNIHLGQFAEIWQKTNRSGAGKISGTFQYSGGWRNPLQGNLQAALAVKDGMVSLQQKIFGMDRIKFSSMTTDVAVKDRVVTFDNGMMDSHLFTASYAGNMKLADNLSTSIIQVQGSMEPRSELLRGLKNDTAVSFIRNQLQDDKLSFTLSGTFLEPGILFKGASGVIDGIIVGGAREK